jgi:uncharacterized OB-fold protein
VKYKYSEADDLYDQDILTKRKCPKCGARIVSHPDCTETCSNKNCEYYHIWIK